MENISWLYLCFQSKHVTPRITLKSLCSSLRPKYISMLGVKYPSKKYTEKRKNIYIRLQIWAFFPFIYFSLFTRAVAKFNFSFVRTLSKISPAADVLTYIFGDLEKLENPRIHHSKSGRVSCHFWNKNTNKLGDKSGKSLYHKLSPYSTLPPLYWNLFSFKSGNYSFSFSTCRNSRSIF